MQLHRPRFRAVAYGFSKSSGTSCLVPVAAALCAARDAFARDVDDFPD